MRNYVGIHWSPAKQQQKIYCFELIARAGLAVLVPKFWCIWLKWGRLECCSFTVSKLFGASLMQQQC